jgi:UDP-N-acetylglucosamine--N-acetylmuramyl-(pentapeptide) pyrophosphoryl-undecaprenol N-acetylglucosamine transferase
MSSEPLVHPTRSLSLFLCGGGTGGHVYPALAVAATLREREARDQEPRTKNQEPGNTAENTQFSLLDSRFSLVYVGSEDGMEAGLVAQESDLPFRAIPAAALRGRSPMILVRNAGTLARGAQAARRLIAMERPLAILGTGGYVCVPLFIAAQAARVPTAIYLPDVVPGMAVRFLARLATAVACNVEDSRPFFPRRTLHVTGYPVRRELFEQDRAACRAAFELSDRLPTLFVYGGSRGARSINQAIAALLPHLLPITQVLHVCGREGDERFLREAAAALPAELRARYRLYPYLYSGRDDKVTRRQGDKVTETNVINHPFTLSPPHLVTPSMVQAFGAADLALCRSGASTLGELPAAGLPAVLVPYPYVHQDENADYLVRHGAALKVRDEQMLGAGRPEAGPLFQNLLRLVEDPHQRAMMAERSRALAQPNAAQRLADLLLALGTSKRSTR